MGIKITPLVRVLQGWYNFIVDEIVPSWSIQQEKIYQKPFLVAARDGFLFLRKPVKQEGFSSDSLEGTQV